MAGPGGFEDFGLLVGRYHATPPTVTDGEPCELLVDENCRLVVAATHKEDDPHSSGHMGNFMLSIRVDDIDGANGAFLADTEGDYQGLLTDPKGQLYVTDKDVLEKLCELVDNGIEVDVKGTYAYGVADDLEDGEEGLVGLTGNSFLNLACIDVPSGQNLCIYGWQFDVDRNAVGRLVCQVTDGLGAKASGTVTIVDFSQLSGDTITVNGTILTEGVDWTAATDNNTTAASLADAINDLLGVSAVAAAAVVTITAVQEGTAGNAITLATSDATNAPVSGATLAGGVDPVISEQKVIKVRLNSSAMPGVAEHWSENGRIEITGATNKRVCVQARQRRAVGTACATGSIHARLDTP